MRVQSSSSWHVSDTDVASLGCPQHLLQPVFQSGYIHLTRGPVKKPMPISIHLSAQVRVADE